MIRGVGQNHAQGVMHRGLSIRGASYGTSSSSPFGSPMGSSMAGHSGGINIRGESGPATVVISNLDPSANAEDIRVCVIYKRLYNMFTQYIHPWIR